MNEVCRYIDGFSGNLAVLCSDERFVRPTMDFLKDKLEVCSCDFIILPGGPEFIASSKADALKRLGGPVKAHRIGKIVLFSHDDCGYYNDLFDGSTKNDIEERQL